jgi:hypothetical protein
MAEQKKSISLLPGYLQTDALTKIFSATVDHLFQASDIEFLNGYIGSRPAWFNRLKDVYIAEPTKARVDYQLSPTPVSIDYLSGQVKNSLFYEDLLGALRFQGGIVDNNDRLFSQEYYSWAPPIDIDKFVNFSSYFWLPAGPNAIILLDTTDLYNQQGQTSYTYTGAYQLSSTGQVFSGSIVFANGLKIKPTSDLTLSYNNKEFYVEGIGRSLILVPNAETFNPAWDVLAWDKESWDGDNSLIDKQYVTIGRGSKDGNIWSQQNRWFHTSVISLSQTLLSDQYSTQALRPIIEFDAGIELYDYGSYNRGYVDICDNGNGDVFGSIVGQPSYSIQNISLFDGMRILVTADTHPTINNRIYTVSGVNLGSIQLTLDTNGQDPSGAPIVGDRVSVRFGSSDLEGKNVYYNGSAWIVSGQQKSLGVPPLFQLYDTRGNQLQDPSVYTSSSFKGSKIFSYQLSDTAPIDQELGIPVNIDQFGDFIFSNNLTIDNFSYILNGQVINYVGEKFAYINGFDGSIHTNGWWKSHNPSRQYIVNNYQVPTTATSFFIDQPPATRNSNDLPSIFVVKTDANGNETTLFENTDYTVNGNIVTLASSVFAGERVSIKTWNTTAPETITGYYELPLNLTANPNNLPITNVSRSQILPQFLNIIQNQYGFAGTGLGSNNFKDSAQNRSFGLNILQHRAPMLKLAMLNSTSFTDVLNNSNLIDPAYSIDYAQLSYVSFYNRFVQTLFNLYKNVTLTGNNLPAEWINRALSTINVGKTSSSPWANSGPTNIPGQYCSIEQTNPTYVPATPARLGITPAYQPVVYIDNTYTTPQLVLQTHDGSRIVLIDADGFQLGTILHDQTSTTNPSQLSHPVAAAWLQFELNLFNSLPPSYTNVDYVPAFDVRAQIPGRWRSTDYSSNEYLSILRSSFDKWVINNQVDYTANTGYDTNNQFSYNYRSVTDSLGQPVPGHWQGIYRYYYDTDRPNTHPWEMLGFSIMPEWWISEYGPAPYTNGNTAMWEDLRDGRIRQGARSGIDATWARPGLLSCIPVDPQGNLLPPFLAGCTANIPSVLDARSAWVFGDGGPVESVWINSSDFKFSLAKAGYLMKPAQFVEYNWDILRTEHVYADETYDQWIYVDTNSRRSSQQFYVHRENPTTLNIGLNIPNESNLSYFGSCGFQHWISEHVISKGYNVTNYFGNIIRGSDVKLAHRMAGFTPTDSFRALVDSFGQLGYNSRLVPSENINLYLYKSNSIEETVYSGVIIEKIAEGWRVKGYDAINPVFTIIPSDVHGDRTSIVIGSQRVTEYFVGLKTTSTVPYDTIFSTRQQVYDFLISYGRWLTNQGWLFTTYDDASNSINNWSKSAKEFLFWSQGVWDNGTFITVSPSADTVQFSQPYGNIQFVNGVVSGTYPVLDRGGQPIQQNNLNVNREQDKITISATNDQGLFLVRLYTTTLEHAVYFDNTTAFNDIIYQPLFNLSQQRMLIYAYRAKNWTGRLDIPGYFLVQNTTSNTWNLTSNFDKSADDITKFFNIEQPTTYQPLGSNEILTTELGGVDTSNLSNLSKHLIGYQNRNYLQNLLLDDATEFEFYQGFIRQKGTATTLNNLLRNNSIIPTGSTFQYFEEWLFRTAWYGGYDLNRVIEFILPQSKINNNPQQIRFFGQQDSDNPNDYVYDIVPADPMLVTPPENYIDPLFAVKPTYGVDILTDMPSAGYVQLGETTYYVLNQSDLLSLYDTQKTTANPLVAGNTVWQFITSAGDWTVLRLDKPNATISYTVPSSVSGEPTVLVTNGSHGLIEGDICIIYGITGVADINGTYTIFNVTSNTFSIDISTFQAGAGGTLLVYRPTRFKNVFDRDSNTPPAGWNTGDLCYVDDGGIVQGAWTVYKFLQNNWVPYRQQQYKINAALILSSELYNGASKAKIADVDYFDPAKGRIVGLADAEISYKTDYDPAKYTSGNSTGYAIDANEAWGEAQIGTVWWDLTAVRYIDYDQGDDSYKRDNWGKLAPGTSIDVYEWVRSTIPPSDWASAVATGSQGSGVGVNGQNITPTGSVRNPDAPNWSEYIEENPDGTSTTYYYFWVKNSSIPPFGPNRQLTTSGIAQLIQSPSIGGNPWYAVISQQNILVGNVSRFLNADQIIQRINYTKTPNDANNFNEWQLLKENDEYSQPQDTLWEKLKSSLTTIDGADNDVPYYKLTDLQRYGNFIRPRQTWFVDRINASSLFVTTANNLIAGSSSPLVNDSSKVSWVSYFNAEEPAPTTSVDYHVTDLGQRDALIGLITPGQTVLVDAVTETNNLWTVWQYTGTSSPWLLERIQYYKVSNYWNYVDWYASGYSSSTTIDLIVATIYDFESLTGKAAGTVVKVLNDGSNKWQLYSYDGSVWQLVGQQDGSIAISDTIYQWAENFGGFDGNPFDQTAFDSQSGVEFSYVIDGLKQAIFGNPNSIEINKLFFTMIKYVLSEQRQVDWIIKTSNISLNGFNQPLSTYQLLPVDLTDSIIGFLNEAKPYHVKISELVTGKTYTDLSNVAAVDFDFPPNFKAPVPADDGSLAWKIYNDTYQSYLANYKTNGNLIRQLKTKLIFDRIATPSQRIGWGSTWSTFAWSAEQTLASYGAIDRIDQFYSPTLGMIPKIISELMIGVDFRSTVLNSLNLNIDIGWSVSPWDSQIGWEPTSQTIINYLDLIVQGGQIPQYDTAIGNGITTEFQLLHHPQNPLDMVVWSDGSIKNYGTEWYVPTYAEKVYIVQGGIHYSVGDQLDLVAGNGIAAVRIQVTAVNHGSITECVILGKGSYQTVTRGPYTLQYPFNHPGIGTDALVEVDWSCQNIVFNTAPAPSPEPNIYILYAGTTFEQAPTDETDTIYSGSDFVIPHVDSDHPEEYYGLRAKDSIRIDTYVQSVGGRPLVNTRVYQTDGVIDQFDIGITPENTVSVFVYLNSVLQKEGLANDFVINFATNKVVFLSPPPSGVLRITAISTGGGSRSVEKAYVVNGGNNYSPNDVITLSGGVGTPAQLQLTSVTNTSAIVVDPGTGYNVGDQVTLIGGSLYTPNNLYGAFTVNTIQLVSVSPAFGGADYAVNDVITLAGSGCLTAAILKVTHVTVDGAVTSLQIINSGEFNLPNAPTLNLASSSTNHNGYGVLLNVEWGIKTLSSATQTEYNVIPTNPVSVSGIGTGATIYVSWAAGQADVINGGLYTKLPFQPLGQASVNPIGGSSSTWNVAYTKRLNEYVYTGNGVTTDYTVPGTTVSYPGGIYVTVDGIPSAYSRLSNAIRLPVAPAVGAVIIINTFDNNQFSVIEETSIDVTNPLPNPLQYPLTNTYPQHSMPYFVTTLVRKNGNLLEPPVIQTWFGDGSSRQFPITVDIVSPTVEYVEIYVDSVLQTLGIDYNISDSILVFTYSPSMLSEIVLVCKRTTTNYFLTTVGPTTYINFYSGSVQNGDNILVTTYAEDADYNFVTEEFIEYENGWDGAPWDILGFETFMKHEYALATTPYDFVTISVWVNEQLLTPTYDYVVENVDVETGWGVDQWDITAWDSIADNRTVVRLGDHIAPNHDSPVTVTYMVGLPERPSVAWRTLISENETLSTVIDDNRKCVILSDVLSNSDKIEISDFTRVSVPYGANIQYVYINDELIGYYEIQQAPTVQHPNRAFLTQIVRNVNNTSGSPEDQYSAIFYNGDSSTHYFATEPVGEAIAETVWVDGKLQRTDIDYSIEINPPSLPPGRYANIFDAPPGGYKNVKIVSLNSNSYDSNVSHVALSTVIDAGREMKLPNGYSWEPDQYGIQYSHTAMAEFLLKHTGTRS